MKKWLITVPLFINMSIISVLADDIAVLQGRLNQVHGFHAKFSQLITDAKGDIIQEGKGELWVKRPNLFNWHMTYPEESLLISDGNTLWFYNPFIEQVTASWLKDATYSVPLILMNCNSASEWHKYNVKQQEDSFFLVPKYRNSDLKQITIKVTNDGTIENLITVDRDGQKMEYQLQNQNNNPMDMTKFNFIPPHGVTLDDQR